MSSLVSRTALEFVTAFRNVTRHRRRVLFTLLIIVGGVLALLMTAGFIMWLMTSMREGAIRSQIGHIQIVRPGFFEGGGADPYRYLLQDDAKADNDRLPRLFVASALRKLVVLDKPRLHVVSAGVR